MLDRIKDILTGDRSKTDAIERGPAEPVSSDAAGARVALLVVLTAGPDETGRWSLAHVGPAARGLRAEVAGDTGASGRDAINALWTGRDEAGRGPTLLTILHENGVRTRYVNAKDVVGDVRGPEQAGPGLAAPFDAQARAVAEAVEARDARVVVGFARADLAKESDRAWAALDEAAERLTSALSPDGYLIVALVPADAKRGEIAIAGPGVAAAPASPANVQWTDVLPTLLRAVGANPPEALDGFPIEEAFPATSWSEADERRVQDHLEKLGYL